MADWIFDGMHVMLPPGAGGKGIVEAAARVATEQICRVYGFTHFQIRAKPFEAPAGVPASEATDEQRQAAIEECERQAAHLKLWSSAEDDCAAVLGPAGRAPAPHGHARVLRPLADRQGKASGVDLTSGAALQAVPDAAGRQVPNEWPELTAAVRLDEDVEGAGTVMAQGVLEAVGSIAHHEVAAVMPGTQRAVSVGDMLSLVSGQWMTDTMVEASMQSVHIGLETPNTRRGNRCATQGRTRSTYRYAFCTGS